MSEVKPEKTKAFFGSKRDNLIEKETSEKVTRTKVLTPNKRRQSLFYRIFLYFTSVFVFSAGTVILFLVAILTVHLEEFSVIDVDEQASTVIIMTEDGITLDTRGSTGKAVGLHEISPHVISALLTVEDQRFFEHFGIDLWGVGRATLANLTSGEFTQGASTITQQLARNLFLSQDKTLHRKIQEMLLSLKLEYQYDKDTILTQYLNRVYFGAGATGINAAAAKYFQKQPKDLNIGEAAMLVGLLKGPSYYNPIASPERALSRTQLVLNAMQNAGAISEHQFNLFRNDPYNIVRSSTAGNNYALDLVQFRAEGILGDNKGSVIIYTTIDPYLQRIAENTVRTELRTSIDEKKEIEASLLSMAPDGSIKAIVGGTNYQKSPFNRAVSALRQPGSTFKPFIYVSALEEGLSPSDTVVDRPVSYRNWNPGNSNNRFMGEISLRDALAYSVNTVAVRLALSVGLAKVADKAHKMGIKSEIHLNPSMSLGTSEVNLMELVGAYAPFANGGRRIEPHVISRITDLQGNELYRYKAKEEEPVLSKQVVEDINEMLSAVMQYGTGHRALIQGWPAAGKTGTTQNNTDAWFVGYTGQFVTGVWIGRDDNKPMPGIYGGQLPAQIWNRYMTSAHAGLNVRELSGL